MLGHLRVSQAGSPEVVLCKVHEDVVDLWDAVQAWGIVFHHDAAGHPAQLVHEDGTTVQVTIDEPTLARACLEPHWHSARLVFDITAKHGTPKMKEVPPAVRYVNVQSLIDQGVPVGVAEGFRDSWQKSSHAKPALHKHNLILKFLEAERTDPHGAQAQTARIALREFLACPGGDTKWVGKEFKHYTISSSHDFLLRKHTKYPAGGRLCTRWVRALTGRPEDIAVILWEDHSKKQFHPGQKYAAANVKDYYLPGVVNFAVDMVRNCPDCIV